MKKIEVITNTDNHAFWFETKNGKKLALPYYFLNRIDINKLQLYSEKETDKYPTLNELVENKTLTLKFGYEIIRKQYKTYNPRQISIKALIAFFKKHGYNVTEKAIYHNMNAYIMDMKSGYRDEENGYHLFTPCGHNPLSFELTSLNKNCDWQTTYTC